MDTKIKRCIYCDNEGEITELLNSGLDANYEGGWPIRLAARLGSCSVVNALLQNGANPHLVSESGASTLQLAVFSRAHWETDRWNYLLSCCDSSQLGDGAAVAIIFNNIPALIKILETGRCNTNVPTTLTGKTVDDLAKGYKLRYLLESQVGHSSRQITPNPSPRNARQSRPTEHLGLQSQQHHRNLSPSVARFFSQTAGQSGLTPPRSPLVVTSPSVRP